MRVFMRIMLITSLGGLVVLASRASADGGTFAYVTNGGTASINTAANHNVSVVDLDAGAVVGSVTVGQTPRGVAFTPHGRFAYVSGSPPTVVETSTATVVAEIPDVSNSFEVALAGPRVALFSDLTYPGGSFGSLVKLVNTTRRAPSGSVAVGQGAAGLDVSADGIRAYVVASNSLSVINIPAGQVETSVSFGRNLFDVAVTPAGSAFVSGQRLEGPSSGAVFRVDLQTMAVADIIDSPFRFLPEAVAASPDGASVWVTSYGNAAVLDARTGALLDEVPLATGDKFGLAFSPDGTRVYIANNNGSLLIVDAVSREYLGFIPVPGNPWAVAVAHRTDVGCPGDCNADGRVSVDELIGATRYALFGSGEFCDALDPGDDGTLSIDDLIGGVRAVLNGCAEPTVGSAPD